MHKMFKLILLIYSFINLCYANSESLKSYNVDPHQISVSGISSGAMMATQIQVAFSSSIMGAGIVAGGPYDCARTNTAIFCMGQSIPLISTILSRTKNWSGTDIDDIKNMAHQKVYMISGTLDYIIGFNVMNQLYNFYVNNGHLIPPSNVVFKSDLRSGHTFPTDFDSPGNNPCIITESPFISNCGFDGAGAILKHMYGQLNARNNGQLTGQLIEFSQDEFINNPTLHGMDHSGWTYIPKSCSSGQKCKLHITFHGCSQGHRTIGDKYIKNSGFIKWADTNNIIVVFPQAVSDFININGCWDWVGYYGLSNYDKKSGVQMNAVKKIIDRITNGHK